MSKNLNKILVIDIEATCWETAPPPNEENEIIEIGICTLDIPSGKPIDRQSILVKPERSTVSEFCTKLTTLTQKKVDKGVKFTEACRLLRKKYNSQDCVWASYGDYDRKQFIKQCESRVVRYPFNPRHINVKTLFALVYALPKELGMAQALEYLNFPLEGTHHRGIDDAYNIAKILSHLLLQARRV